MHRIPHAAIIRNPSVGRVIRPEIRPGFTLIELLVVISLIGLLIALLLPAVQSARESARRAHCANNLKQIALGVLTYEHVHGGLPMAVTLTPDPRFLRSGSEIYWDKSYLVRILPQIDQQPLYDACNQSLSIFAWEHETVRSTFISLFSCPSDSSTSAPRPASMSYLPETVFTPGTVWKVGFTNYGAILGSLITLAYPDHPDFQPRTQAQRNDEDGAFPSDRSLPLSAIIDGTSNTLLLGERRLDWLRNVNGTGLVQTRAGQWYVGELGQTLLTTIYPMNMKISGFRYDWDSVPVSAGWVNSAHPSGANVAMADGSVRFVKDSVSSWPIDMKKLTPAGILVDQRDGLYLNLPARGIWQALATRNGGEPIGDY